MKPTDQPMPRARDEGLVIQELADETLVYDLERHRAHALNRTAAWVWRRCDGKTTIAAIAASLPGELGLPTDREAVWIALQRLGRAHLLEELPRVQAFEGSLSRRRLVRKLALAGGLAVVTSIVAPEAAQATTCIHKNQSCTSSTQCCSGCSCNGMVGNQMCTGSCT